MFKTRRRTLTLLGAVVAAGTASVMAATSAFAAAEWTVTESPDIGADYSFEAIDVVTDEDAWAVGASSTDSGTGTVAAHWDGTAWTHTPTPEGWDFQSVSAVTTDDVWAVGRGESGSVSARWDGSAWRSVESPTPELPGGQTAGLYAVDAHPSGNAWAGGCGDGESGSTAFAQQWDGETEEWTAVELPIPDGVTNSCVFDISYVADDDVWVFGTTWEKKAWILHWNGREWQAETTPGNTESVTVTGAYLNRNGELCGSGYTLDDNLTPHPYLLCRDEGTWTEVQTPKLDAFISSIGGDGDGGVYLAGTTFDDHQVLLHYDGDTVTEATPPSSDKGSGIAAIDSAPGSTRVWVAGSAGPKGFAAYSG